MKSQQLVQLVNQWATYEEQTDVPTLPDFCRWYLANQPLTLPDQDDIFDQIPLNGLLGKLVGRTGLHDHLYTKKALQELGLNNVDDMMYLHMIRYLASPRKSELIHHMLSEFPSGIEIIRRLLKQGLIEERPDEIDKRSKRVCLTPTGEQLLLGSYGLLQQAGQLMFDALNEDEKRLLAYLLGRLDTVHTPHHKTFQNAPFPVVYQQLLPLIQQLNSGAALR